MLPYALRLTQAPAGDVVTLDQAKAHLRVDYADDDALIQTYLDACTEQLDGDEGDLRQCLLSQAWELSLNVRFPHCRQPLVIPLGPVVSVDSVGYIDTAGNAQTLDPALYTVNNLGGVKMDTYLEPKAGTVWPATQCQSRAVTVAFTAGFGDAGADVPARIRAAILQMVADLYRSREAYTRQPIVANPALRRLLSRFVRDTL